MKQIFLLNISEENEVLNVDNLTDFFLDKLSGLDAKFQLTLVSHTTIPYAHGKYTTESKG